MYLKLQRFKRNIYTAYVLKATTTTTTTTTTK